MASRTWKRVVTGIVLGSAISCAGAQNGDFEALCADDHEREAIEHHRRADKHFARIREHHARDAERGPGSEGWSYASPQELYDPDEPEHYTIDPRVHSPVDRDVDKARYHRDLALAHEAAAARLHGGCPTPHG